MEKIQAKDIAKLLNATIIGDEKAIVSGINTIEDARNGDLTFLSNRKYLKYLKTTKASCVIVDKSIDVSNYKGKTFIICDDAYLCFAKLLNHFFGFKPKEPYISPKAQIAETAQIDKSAHISDFVVVEEDVTIGKNTTVMPFVYIGKGATIGDECLIYPTVTIRERSIIGNRVIIHSGSVIGSDGFGYATTKEKKHIKIPQMGNVIIEDDVEIGANVTIDRAALKSTRIGKGTKIDNLVQIAHNVEIGQNSLIVAQSGISGSTKIGNRVTLAGQTGIAGHLNIVDDVIITAKSGVGSSVKKPGIYSGIPICDHKAWLRSSVVMPKLHEMYKKLRELEKTLEELKRDARNRRD